VDLYQYNKNSIGGCYGLILDFNLMIGFNGEAGFTNLGNQDVYTYNSGSWPADNRPEYVETGRIYLSWLGSDKNKKGAVGETNTVTFLTMEKTIANAVLDSWDRVSLTGTPSATSLGASEEGVVAPFNAPVYRNRDGGYQFGYKLVNDPGALQWYVQIALYNDTNSTLRITHTAKILNLFTSS
jgi:hypothetical protein